MSDAEMLEMYRQNKERIDYNKLVEVKRDDNYVYYECLCGGLGHYGLVPLLPLAKGQMTRVSGNFLTCSHSRPVRQWLIRHPDAVSIIQSEEEKYLKLIQTAPALVRKVVKKRGWSPETQAYLLDTHGIDAWLSADIHSELLSKF